MMMKRNQITIGILLIIITIVIYYFFVKDNSVVSRQEMVHMNRENVMPFSLSKTLHIFQKNTNGGTQSVVVRDVTDIADLSLIRMHLQMEAQNFAIGNFSDPTGLHGEDMPGLSLLKKNYPKMKVAYSEIDKGAKIDFVTTDNEMIIAVHSWFDAQVSDHGNDAIMQ